MSTTAVSVFVEAVGWTLLHFLWQAAAVALVFWCVLRAGANRSPHVRYVAGCVSLLLMFAGVLTTFAWQWTVADQGVAAVKVSEMNNTSSIDSASQGPLSVDIPPVGSPGFDAELPVDSSRPVDARVTTGSAPDTGSMGAGTLGFNLRRSLPWIVGAWALGVGVLSLRLSASWLALRRVRLSGTQAPDIQWQDRFDQLRRRLGVSRPVRLITSAAGSVPMVIGWLRPVVLVPQHLLTALGFPQLEAILAHELAHVRRHDYLVNLLQNALETLFFYHPAVWWVSGRVRVLREHCCDDMAAAVCGGPLDYARALTALEEFRGAKPALGVAATDGPLIGRIRRLAGLAEPAPSRAAWPASILSALVAVAVVLPLTQLRATESGDGPPTDSPPDTSVDGIAEQVSGKHPDNLLGLADAELIKLFETGKILRSVAREGSAFYVKHNQLPKNVEGLFEDYQQLRHGIIVDPFASESGLVRLKTRRDGDGGVWVQVWSVGPDGDWDDGQRIDSADPTLNGDLGAEMRIGRGKINWLADETMAMHLEGKRLSHYLAAKGPKLPKPELKDDGLKWGPVVDGLQMAANLIPQQPSFALGEKIELEFHVRNVSDYTITIARLSWSQDTGPDSFVIKNEKGERIDVGHGFYSRIPLVQRDTLKPGEVAVFTSSALAFLAEGIRGAEHPVGHTVNTTPGRHTLQFNLEFPDGETNGVPGLTDWQGTLGTGEITLLVTGGGEQHPPADESNDTTDAARSSRAAGDDAASVISPTELDRIAKLVGLTKAETDALREIDQQGHLKGFSSDDVAPIDLDDTLPGLGVLAQLSQEEVQSVDNLMSNGKVKSFDALIKHKDGVEATAVEQTAIAKLDALWHRQRASAKPIEQLQNDKSLGKVEADTLAKLSRFMRRRRAPSILAVRVIFKPVPSGKSSWSRLFPQKLEDGTPYYMAMVRAGINSPFPVRMKGPDQTLFNVNVISGNDDKLQVRVSTENDGEVPPIERKPLSLVRDEPVEFEVDGKVYSLVYPSSWIARSSSQRVQPTAHLIVAYHPDKAAAENTTQEPAKEPNNAATGASEESGVASADAQQEPPIVSVTIRGKAIDDETGESVSPLVTQAGKFEPGNPSKITWGYSEGRSSRRDGSFSTTVRWSEGWTARVLADGYLPHPVLEGPPPPGEKTVNVVIRLKRGRLVRGRVLDHQGKPLPDAAVFANGPTGLNLAQGKAWQSWGGEDEAAKPAMTDAAGRFELPAGEATRVAVSSTKFDAWPAEIPEEGELVIRLPEPATVHFDYEIEGGTRTADVFYQLLGHRMQGFKRLESSRELPVDNGGRLTLASLTPGKYQFCRHVSNRLGDIGFGAMLDRQFVELKAGETRNIRFVREAGARIRGKITWPEETKLDGIVVSIKSPQAEIQPISGVDSKWQTVYDSQTAGTDGSFLTERIPPGRYLLVAEAYAPQSDEQRVSTGIIGPALTGERTINVPETGEVPPVELRLGD